MNLKQLFNDDRAVSPVIGVILMVAITVILAAVIGTFVLGLGDKVSTTTPSASFQFDYSNEVNGGWDNLTVSHSGGDSISASQLNLTSDTAFRYQKADGTASALPENKSKTFAVMGVSDKVSAGDTVTAVSNTNEFDSATFRVVWSAASGDTSAVLGKWTGPDAS